MSASDQNTLMQRIVAELSALGKRIDDAFANIRVSREVLVASRTYYVLTTGSDSNDGRTNSSSGAFLTIQRAIDVATSSLDTSSYDITIQVGDGTYVTNTINCKNILGSGVVNIFGNSGNMNAVVIDGGFSKVGPGTNYNLVYMQIKKSSGTAIFGIFADSKSKISFSNINFSTGLSYHLWSQSFSEIWCAGPYTISAGASYHIVCSRQGNVTIFTNTVTLTGTPAFGGGFVDVEGNSYFYAYSITFVGLATGTRYFVATNGVISTFGGGANYFPGNVPGSSSTGGQYS